MIFTVCYVLLALSLVLTAIRLFRGPTAPNRILAIDLLAVTTAGAALLHAVEVKRSVSLDVVMVLGVIVFFGTVALAGTLKRER